VLEKLLEASPGEMLGRVLGEVLGGELVVTSVLGAVLLGEY
jgi:hypothetical protein